jgi:hypothetical protein
MDRNQTKICPGKKFVTNEYPGIYILYTFNAKGASMFDHFRSPLQVARKLKSG